LDSDNAKWLEMAKKVFEYWASRMLLPTGQVRDGIHANGDLNGRVYSYNQGMFVKACVALHQVLPDSLYLSRANLTLSFILRNETSATGVLQEDGDHGTNPGAPCGDENFNCQMFKGITFRYLADYLREAHNASVSMLLRTSLQALLDHRAADYAYPAGSWESAPSSPLTFASQVSGNAAIVSWTKLVCDGIVTPQATTQLTTAPPPTTTLPPPTTTTAMKTSVSNPPTTVPLTAGPVPVLTDPVSTSPPGGDTGPVSSTMVIAGVIAFAVVGIIGGVIVVLVMRRRALRARNEEYMQQLDDESNTIGIDDIDITPDNEDLFSDL
jgi:hypothetical protein